MGRKCLKLIYPVSFLVLRHLEGGVAAGRKVEQVKPRREVKSSLARSPAGIATAQIQGSLPRQFLLLLGEYLLYSIWREVWQNEFANAVFSI